MQGLYPALEPYRSRRLPVGPPHELYIEECGNPEGLPVLFLHGGPGAGCLPYHRQFFDPTVYRIILFDQRGAGQSTPHAELGGNTTQALVDDIEAIRKALGIKAWVVFGGSWGSTLGLVYAEAHPEKVLGLILRGIFLCRPQDIHWFYQHGAGRIFPEYWEQYLAPVPEAERNNMVSAYYRLLTSDDETVRLEAARAWSLWEGRTISLLPCKETASTFAGAHFALAMARIECHYFMHDSFLEPGQILRDAYKLKDIPGVIVHGRYDVVCTVDNALALHTVWPQADLHIIPDAGHAASEPGIVDALVSATRDMARKINLGAA
ncbi:prolyl aminopeptidase [Sulfuriflexus mobilis]|uniref:prolyl aminopeptidase n=1 Tax=Sulfuriflexus mobilis TaxID=1811807 RepID=UPI000F826904|nr:prolyl aminopeptidase [Sulfuriflexus mobilis]